MSLDDRGHDLDLALIGNCRVGALVDRHARIVWWCFPRFDSDPIFSHLLAGDEEKGFCDIVLADCVDTTSQYVRNTAIVETVLTDARGGQVRVTDFAPRFEHY
ncbi:MAG: trehalase-like domain-containing protein, partial [Beijerinckiaceae bacterium]